MNRFRLPNIYGQYKDVLLCSSEYPSRDTYRLKSIYQILFHDRKTKQLAQIDMRFANLG